MKTPINVLFLEDSDMDAQLLLDELECGGFQVHGRRVEAGDEMLEALCNHTWDVVLADNRLPKFDGMRALELMKSIGVDCPFILVSGAIGEEAAVDALRAGARDFVAKGNLARLVPAVRREVRDAAVRRENRRMEQELRDGQQRLQSILDHSPALIYVSDCLGRLVLTNRRFDETFGRGADTLLGKTAAEVFPIDVAVLRREHDLAALEKDAPIALEEKYDLESGTRTFLTVCFPLRDTVGEFTGVGTIATDITEQKHLEAQYLHAQKMEAFGQLAGGVAHDFNNIVGAMMLMISMLEKETGISPSMASGLSDLRRSAERAASLTRQLLLFSRREALRLRLLELNHAVEAFLKMLRHLLPENIDVAVLPYSEPLWVHADPGMIEQVIMNLSLNARDAMPHGGRLTIQLMSVRPEECQPSGRVRGRKLACIRVVDTGSGMDSATLKRIFEPFFTTKPAGKGTGLGLATVYGIVGQHSGWIGVDSVVGKGTEFRIYLPAARPPGATAAESEPEEIQMGGHERILLVEDDAQLRDIASMCLRRHGYQVTEANSGAEALSLSASCPGSFDLLITDIVMPGGVSGLQLVETLSRNNKELRVLIVTGYSAEDASSLSALTPAGAAYLQKPFSTETLLSAVRNTFSPQRGASICA